MIEYDISLYTPQIAQRDPDTTGFAISSTQDGLFGSGLVKRLITPGNQVAGIVGTTVKAAQKIYAMLSNAAENDSNLAIGFGESIEDAFSNQNSIIMTHPDGANISIANNTSCTGSVYVGDDEHALDAHHTLTLPYPTDGEQLQFDIDVPQAMNTLFSRVYATMPSTAIGEIFSGTRM